MERADWYNEGFEAGVMEAKHQPWCAVASLLRWPLGGDCAYTRGVRDGIATTVREHFAGTGAAGINAFGLVGPGGPYEG